jgi:hypothetical protein
MLSARHPGRPWFQRAFPRRGQINALDVRKNFDHQRSMAHTEKRAAFNKIVRRQPCEWCARSGKRCIDGLTVLDFRFDEEVNRYPPITRYLTLWPSKMDKSSLKSRLNIACRLLCLIQSKRKLNGGVQPHIAWEFLPLAVFVGLHFVEAVVLANTLVHASFCSTSVP